MKTTAAELEAQKVALTRMIQSIDQTFTANLEAVRAEVRADPDAPPPPVPLTPEQLAVCAALGCTPENFAAARDARR